MKSENAREEFIILLTDCQGRLAAYIRTLVLDADRAKDILQETNLVLWRKADEFVPGTDFGAWACKIAYFQTLAHRRDQGRERLLFDDELLGQLAVVAEARADLFDQRMQAMQSCLGKLAQPVREVLHAKYHRALSVSQLAEQFGRSGEAIKKTLFRARRELLKCIERSLAEERRP